MSPVSPLTRPHSPSRHHEHSSKSSEESSPVSPLSRPRSRPRLRHLHTLADIDDGDAEIFPVQPAKSIAPAAPFAAIAGPKPNYKSANGKEYPKASLTGPGALNFLPSEMKRVNTPPAKDASSKGSYDFKGFFFDLRGNSTA